MGKNGRKLKCEECGKKFWMPESRIRRKRIRFCSNSCRWAYQRRHPEEFWRKRAAIKCLSCGKEFLRLKPLGNVGFCSRACYNKHRARAKDAANPNCRRCGKGLFQPHKCKSGLCLECWRKHAAEEGLCFKPRLNGWSWKHEKCVRCDGTDSEHKTKGICGRCYSKEQARRRKGTWEKTCEICGEARTINRAHIIPGRLGGPFVGWNLFCLCALHHGCFDEDELTAAEWKKIEAKVRAAFKKFDFHETNRYGRQGLPWALRRLARPSTSRRR